MNNRERIEAIVAKMESNYFKSANLLRDPDLSKFMTVIKVVKGISHEKCLKKELSDFSELALNKDSNLTGIMDALRSNSYDITGISKAIKTTLEHRQQLSDKGLSVGKITQVSRALSELKKLPQIKQ